MKITKIDHGIWSLFVPLHSTYTSICHQCCTIGSCSIILMLSWAQLALFTTTEFCCASPHPILYYRVWVETFPKNLIVKDTSFLIPVNGIKPCRYILIQFLAAELTVQEALSCNYHYRKCFKCFIVMFKLKL